MSGPASVVVTTDRGGVDPFDVSCLVDQVAIRHGRTTRVDEFAPSTCTIDLTADDLGDEAAPPNLVVGSWVTVLSASGRSRFVGRITDLQWNFEAAGTDTPHKATGQLTAVSGAADLARDKQTTGRATADLTERGVINAVNALVDFPAYQSTVFDATLQSGANGPDGVNGATVRVPAYSPGWDLLGLLTDLAAGAGGELSETAGNGTLLRYQTFWVWSQPWATGGTAPPPADPVLTLDVCDLLAGTAWELVYEVVNVTMFTAADSAGTNESGYVAESVAEYGRVRSEVVNYWVGVGGSLAPYERANLRAYLGAFPSWQTRRLDIDTADLSAGDYASLLQLETGDVVVVENMPDFLGAPATARLRVEGWEEQWSGVGHVMSLNVSNADWDAVIRPPLGPIGVRWVDVPAGVRWVDVPAGVAWVDANTIDVLT